MDNRFNNYVLFEDRNSNITSTIVTDEINIPEYTVAFRYYDQEHRDENGYVPTKEFRIGTPVVFCMASPFPSYTEEYKPTNKDDVLIYYCLYNKQGTPVYKEIHEDTTLVKNFDELQEAFDNTIKKSKGLTK